MEQRSIALCVYGGPRSGKTALVRAIYWAATGRLHYKYDPRALTPGIETITYDVLKATFRVDDVPVDVTLVIWELSLGISTNFQMLQDHYRRCDAALVVYAANDPDSFAYARELLNHTLSIPTTRQAGALVETKIDAGSASVQAHAALELAGAHGLGHFAISAKNDFKVAEVVTYVVSAVVRADRARRTAVRAMPEPPDPLPSRWITAFESFVATAWERLRARVWPSGAPRADALV